MVDGEERRRAHGAGVTGAECRYYGRDFTAEMALLCALIAGPPPLNRHMLSKEFCRRIGWFKPDGGLKDMMARVAMLAMHRDGLIALPAPQGRQNRPRPIVFGPDTEAPLFTDGLDEVRPLDLRPVVRGTREGKLWNEFRPLPLSRIQDRRPDATPFMTETAGRSPCSRPSSPRASDGHPSCARRTYPSSSTTRGS